MNLRHFAPFLVVIVLMVIIAVVFIAVLNYRLKKRIIETGQINDAIAKNLFKPTGWSLEILKWGLILLSGGMGLVVIEFLPFQADESPLPYGVEAIFIALGFLGYYAVVRKENLSNK
jgi:uncharacterized membrane protein